MKSQAKNEARGIDALWRMLAPLPRFEAERVDQAGSRSNGRGKQRRKNQLSRSIRTNPAIRTLRVGKKPAIIIRIESR